MKSFALQRPEREYGFIGTWHIHWMEMWRKAYFNMEVQAYIEVKANETGEFQFGLVSGWLEGEIEQDGAGRERFAFTWDGQDEMDPASGSGWLRLKSETEGNGVIRFHGGDRSKFKVRRAG